MAESSAGQTWRAVREADGLAVVGKVWSVALQGERSDFLKEIEDLAAAAGRQVAPVLDAGLTAQGRPWLVRPFFAGGSLADRLAARGPLSLEEAVRAALAAAAGLATLHEHGLVHGSVRPTNLLFAGDDASEDQAGGRDAIVVADAVLPSVDAARARQGDQGALEHQAPEVLQGRSRSSAADVYGLASTLHTALAGRSPFAAEAARGVAPLLLRLLGGPPPDVRRADLPPALRTALSAAMAAEVDRRPSLTTLVAELRTAVERPPEAPPSQRVDTLPPATPVPEAPGGQPLGTGYLLHELIGRGATGKVWRGSVRADGHSVAVKVLRPELAEETTNVVRFLRELEVLKRLRHPHVVRVRDQVWEGSTLAIVMDLIEGVDLRRFAPAAVAPSIACELLAQLGSGLAAVHGADIVHRDLKPENVLVESDGSGRFHVRITDFGVIRLAGGASLTREDQLVGTPEYLAPELVAGQPVTAAADVYALGVIAYELLSGRRPFEAPHIAGVLEAHRRQAPRRPEGLPDELWELVASCLAKDPARRPAAAELAQSFRSVAPAVAGLPALPSPGSPGAPPPAAEAAPPISPEAVREPLPTGAAERRLPTPPPAEAPPRRDLRWPVLGLSAGIVTILGIGVGAVVAGVGADPNPTTTTTTVAPVRAQLLAVTAGARPAGNGVVDVAFRAVADRPGFQQYRVFRDGILLPDAVPSTATSVQIADLHPDTHHCFRIVAVFLSERPPSDPPAPDVCLQAKVA